MAKREERSCKVFISFSHDSRELLEKVLRLSDKLLERLRTKRHAIKRSFDAKSYCPIRCWSRLSREVFGNVSVSCLI
jgi:hypothetical protein